MNTRCIRWVLAAVAMPAVFAGSAFASDAWLESYGEALSTAKKENKPVLVDFTSSDSCPPCITMKREVFDTTAFKKFAAGNLVLLEVDFPGRKVLPPQQINQNAMLAQKFGAINEMGMLITPTLALVTPSGKLVAVKEGAFLSVEELIAWTEDVIRKSQAEG